MGKKNKVSLGRALFKSRFIKPSIKNTESDKWLHTSELDDGSDWAKLNLKSVTEQSSLDEFLNTAELAGKEFESERLNLKFVKAKSSAGVLSGEELKKIKSVQEKNLDLLRIPRRPLWKGTELDSKALQFKEREAFLDWRRNLARAQENEALSMTPFEKNLEFWRQLWRVIERSDVVVQIVDARNPLLFYCKDLEKYVTEIDENKLNLLLINKSDFLTDRQRLEWLRYFEKNNVKVAFWSAAISSQENDLHKVNDLEQDSTSRSRTNSELTDIQENSDLDDDNNIPEEEKNHSEDSNQANGKLSSKLNKFNILNDEKEQSSEEENLNDDYESETEDDKNQNPENYESADSDETESNETGLAVEEKTIHECVVKSTEESEKSKDTADLFEMSDDERLKCKILSREELIDLFKNVHKHIVDKAKPGCTTIGLVGYPNVGKSSTINALLQNKRVAVSETPGKTKHYQTMFIDDELLLCDCPGLVFPSFVSTKGELIINGILPIDQMRDFTEPINLVIQHIPKRVVEMFYGIEIRKPKEHEDQNRDPTAEELCSAYSKFRGYMNHKGMPDVNRGARYILKDYVNGKLLYCYSPPGFDPVSFQDHRYETSKEVKYLEKVKKIEKLLKSREEKPELSNFDREFFSNLQSRALTKGGIVGYHRKNKAIQSGVELASLNNAAINLNPAVDDKAWKKHHNVKRREKLRRLNRHLDEHDD